MASKWLETRELVGEVMSGEGSPVQKALAIASIPFLVGEAHSPNRLNRWVLGGILTAATVLAACTPRFREHQVATQAVVWQTTEPPTSTATPAASSTPEGLPTFTAVPTVEASLGKVEGLLAAMGGEGTTEMQIVDQGVPDRSEFPELSARYSFLWDRERGLTGQRITIEGGGSMFSLPSPNEPFSYGYNEFGRMNAGGGFYDVYASETLKKFKIVFQTAIQGDGVEQMYLIQDKVSRELATLVVYTDGSSEVIGGCPNCRLASDAQDGMPTISENPLDGTLTINGKPYPVVRMPEVATDAPVVSDTATAEPTLLATATLAVVLPSETPVPPTDISPTESSGNGGVDRSYGVGFNGCPVLYPGQFTNSFGMDLVDFALGSAHGTADGKFIDEAGQLWIVEVGGVVKNLGEFAHRQIKLVKTGSLDSLVDMADVDAHVLYTAIGSGSPIRDAALPQGTTLQMVVACP